MATSEGYGQRLAERLHIEQAPVILSRVLRTADMAVSETRCDVPAQELNGSFQREDAFLVTFSLRDFPNREYWEEGRLISVSDVRAGQTCIHDLKRDPVARLDKPYHVLFFYLPRGALDAIADDTDARRIGDLNYKPVAIDDATITGLGRAMLPALSHPDRANQLFVEHILLGLGIHVAQTYGGIAAAVTTDPGWARGMANEARQGSSQRQPRRPCATQGGGSGVRSVGELFLACVSPLHGSRTAQMASDASRRGSQAEAA
jgi:hypothetical protein